MSKDSVKTQIDIDITNKTTSKSISPLNVGGNMKAVVDLIPDITSKENISNKSTNIITDNTSDIKYPTTKAVATYVDNLAAESYVNKSINIVTDALSDIKYPSVKAVKTYVDTKVATGIPLSGTTPSNPVSGVIEVIEGVDFVVNGDGGNNINRIRFSEGDVRLSSEILGTGDTAIIVGVAKINIISSFSGSAGLGSNQNFSPNITDLDYTQKIYVDQKVADSRPYKVYTALLSQSGTNAPVATILENTLGGTVVFSYSGVGSYVATLTGVFILNKTWCSITSTASADVTVTAGRSSDNTVNINSFLSGTLTNSIMSPTCLEIRVYN